MAKDLTAALQALTEQAQGTTSRVDKALPAARQAPEIPARSGTSGIIRGAGAGGIASPLVEVDYANRTFHAVKTYTSTDGIFTIKLKPVQTMTFHDANDATVVIEYKDRP